MKVTISKEALSEMDCLSELVTAYRHINLLNQKDLADEIDVSTVTISNIENRKIKAGHSTLKKIMKACEVDDLLEMVRLNDNNIYYKK